MSSALMRAYCERLRKHIELPPGFEMKVDDSSDCILVSNKKLDLGFAITKLSCRDHPISWIAKTSKLNIEQIISIGKSTS